MLKKNKKTILSYVSYTQVKMLIAMSIGIQNIILRIRSTAKICATLELRNFLNAEVGLHWGFFSIFSVFFTDWE